MPRNKKRRLGIDKLMGTISCKDLERVCHQAVPDLGGDPLARRSIEREFDKEFGPFEKDRDGVGA